MKRIHGAFICARYSTDNQNPDSIEVQVSKCTEWCNKNNMPILGVFADEAVSGMKDARPNYEAMMSQLRLGLADTVVIYDQSRMFRKMTAWLSFRSELTAMGVTVISVTQPAVGKDLRDPMNFMTEGSMALFNQMHVLITRQKVIDKMRYMANNGQHTGGKPALGYQVEDGRLVICEAEAAIVRRIFTEYDSGLSYREIIAGLNRDGIKTKRGNPFGTNSLHDLLKNEKYIGILTYGARPYREDGTRNSHAFDGDNVVRIEDALPAIVDKDLFNRVREKMNLNKKQQGGRPPVNRDYPLKGKVFCGDCKAAMSVSISKQTYHYYKCSAKKRTHQCTAKPIAVDLLEQTVADIVRSYLGCRSNVEQLIDILKEQRAKIVDGAATTMARLVQERAAISAKLEHAAEAILSGLSSPTLTAKVAELERQKDLIDAQAQSLKQSVDAATIPETKLRETLDLLLSSKSTDIRAILSIVYRIEVYEDHIDVWTILDTLPDNTNPDLYQDGVPITPGITSGVPIVFVTAQFLRFTAAIKRSSS